MRENLMELGSNLFFFSVPVKSTRPLKFGNKRERNSFGILNAASCLPSAAYFSEIKN